MFKDSLVQTNINSLFIIQGVPYCYVYCNTSFAGRDGWSGFCRKKDQQQKSVRLKQRKKEKLGEEGLRGVTRACHIASIF